MALRIMLPTLALSLGAVAAAQELTELLPAETFFALGMQNLEEASAQLEDFQEEFRRLEVADALQGLGEDAGGAVLGGAASGGAAPGGAGTQDFDDLTDETQRALQDLGSLEVFGQEAWIAVSVTPFNPLPALTLLTRVTPDGAERVRAQLEAAELNTEAFEESGTPFFQLPLEGGGPVSVVAYALADDLLVLSTNPDELRGVLRRHAGADEPSLATAESYRSTLETLESGTFYSFFDYAQLAEAAAPYGQNLGFDPLVQRLTQAFTTAGAVGSVVRLTDDALVTESFQLPNREGGDATLYSLLSDERAASADVAVPEGALSATVSAVDLSGWYAYLNELALTVPELGGDLDSLILSFTGLNLRESIFSWTGDQLVTLTTGLGEVAQPGVPSDNLLGDTVYLIEATNAAAAQRGLGALLQNLSQVTSSLSDPEGGAGSAQREQTTVAGVEVTRFSVAPGVTLLYAVEGGYALIATSDAAMERALSAQVEGGREDLFGEVPGGASSFSYTDSRATFEGLSQQLSSQLQLAAGMGGASGLDFDAVEDASEAVEAFFGFVATRLSESVGYSERTDGGIRSYSETAVVWQE
jgi:hypothetical protein